MGEAEWIDLNEMARGLDLSKLAEVADFIGYLKAKQEREIDGMAETIELAGAAEMAGALADLERALPSEQVQAWLDDLRAGALPVRFNPETGEIEEVRA